MHINVKIYVNMHMNVRCKNKIITRYLVFFHEAKKNYLTDFF